MAPTLNVIIPGSWCFVLVHEYLGLCPQPGAQCNAKIAQKVTTELEYSRYGLGCLLLPIWSALPLHRRLGLHLLSLGLARDPAFVEGALPEIGSSLHAILTRVAQVISRLGYFIDHCYPPTRSAIVAKRLVADAICASISSRRK